VDWLEEISFPGALRQLYTQIFQCAPGDTYFYCGQAPSGYGAYREDSNSSHQYFDNLFLYYYLTGDATVVNKLSVGANSMRRYYCSKRPASACSSTDAPPSGEVFVGRVWTQWNNTFQFLGLASGDAGYLQDWKSGLARQYTFFHAQLVKNSKNYGFMSASASFGTTDQSWMTALYDSDLLYRYAVETNNAPLASIPVLKPSEIFLAYSNTFADYVSRVYQGNPPGDGTAFGSWANLMNFTFSGNRIGGTLGTVSFNGNNSDPLLYDSAKPAVATLMLRAADMNGLPQPQVAVDLLQIGLRDLQPAIYPLGKVEGIYSARIHEAVAHINGQKYPMSP
jgi:hypothetical protein